MRLVTKCSKCGSKNIDYLGNDRCYCHNCKTETETRDEYVMSPFERTERAVYATGNKWAIENWRATHY